MYARKSSTADPQRLAASAYAGSTNVRATYFCWLHKGKTLQQGQEKETIAFVFIFVVRS